MNALLRCKCLEWRAERSDRLQAHKTRLEGKPDASKTKSTTQILTTVAWARHGGMARPNPARTCVLRRGSSTFFDKDEKKRGPDRQGFCFSR